MKKIAVLDDYDGSVKELACWQKLAGTFDVQFFDESTPGEKLADFEVIVANRDRTPITRYFLRRTKKLKHLAMLGDPAEHADLEALQRGGIKLSSAGSNEAQAAAEQTIALLLAATKHVTTNDASMRSGEWQGAPSSSLAGKTLGILGLGRVGTTVAQFGLLMGMKVTSWGPTKQDKQQAGKMKIPYLFLDEVLQKSDVVVICLRFSESTRGLLGLDQINYLKSGSYLVNTARAEIVHREALYTALESGRIFGAFDVFHREPLPPDDPIRHFPNVVLSPHIGYVTHDMYVKCYAELVDHILDWELRESESTGSSHEAIRAA